MMRKALLSGLAALALSTAAASAQEAGGITLSQQVLNTPHAQEQVLDHVFGRLQQFQQLRAVAGSPGSGGAGGAAALATPNTPDHASARQQNMAIAQQLMQQRMAQRAAQAQLDALANAPPPVFVNAVDSPVAIGNNNIVRQQVATSTAIGGNAQASAAATGRGDGATASQSATSKAVSVGGDAHAVAINSNVAGQGNP